MDAIRLATVLLWFFIYFLATSLTRAIFFGDTRAYTFSILNFMRGELPSGKTIPSGSSVTFSVLGLRLACIQNCSSSYFPHRWIGPACQHWDLPVLDELDLPYQCVVVSALSFLKTVSGRVWCS